MKLIYKLVASFAGIGYVKGGGTLAAAIAVFAWYYLMPSSLTWQIGLTILVFLIGVGISNRLEKEWGKDSNKIVIDEALGMMIGLIALPISFTVVLFSFLGFRFFDIVKPLGIRKSEALKGGWGVMVDDLWAGVYTNIVMQLLVYWQILT